MASVEATGGVVEKLGVPVGCFHGRRAECGYETGVREDDKGSTGIAEQIFVFSAHCARQIDKNLNNGRSLI